MTISAARRGRRWLWAAAIPGIVLVLGALAVAQDPPAAQTPPGQAAPQTATQPGDPATRLSQIEEAIQAKELEMLELRRSLDDSLVLHSFLLLTTGNFYAFEGEGMDYLPLDPRSQQLERAKAERDRLMLERDAIRHSEEVSNSGFTPVNFLDIVADPVNGGETAAHPPDPADVPGSDLAGALAADTSGWLSFFTSGEAMRGDVPGWFEYRPAPNRMPVSGQMMVTPGPNPGQFFVTGAAADGFTVVIGDMNLPSGGSPNDVRSGRVDVKLITPTSTRPFNGTVHVVPIDGGGNVTVTVPGGNELPVLEPAVNLTDRLGGPILYKNRIVLFGRDGLEVEQLDGNWVHENGPTLRFESRQPRLQLTLDYELDRATGTYQPPPGAGAPPQPITINAGQLTFRTPQFWIGTRGTSSTFDPGALRDSAATAKSLATIYGANGNATAKAIPENRLGWSAPSWVTGIPPASTPKRIFDLRPDPKSQLGAGRLVTPAAAQRARLSPPSLLATRLTDVVRAVFGATPAPPATLGFRSAPGRPARARTQAGRTNTEQQTVYFRSLGRSTGSDAIEMVLAGDAQLPPGLDNLLVLEPLSRDQTARIEREIAEETRGQPTSTTRLVMYCLNHTLLTPAAGQIMRLASPETHQRFAHVLSIWDAADRARSTGTLQPDSDPDDYYHSIVQWAIWTKEQGFDERRFGDAFVTHTRRNLEQSGQLWSADVETVVRSVVPNRWRDVQSVLR